jgi:hypothetical protein
MEARSEVTCTEISKNWEDFLYGLQFILPAETLLSTLLPRDQYLNFKEDLKGIISAILTWNKIAPDDFSSEMISFLLLLLRHLQFKKVSLQHQNQDLILKLREFCHERWKQIVNTNPPPVSIAFGLEASKKLLSFSPKLVAYVLTQLQVNIFCSIPVIFCLLFTLTEI